MSETAHRMDAAGPAGDGPPGAPFDRWLLKVVDLGLAACIFIVPLLMGGRQALGQLALVSLAAGVALVWTLRQSLRRKFFFRPSSVEVLLLVGLVLLVVQTIPLPQSVLSWLAPRNAELLPLWSADADPAAALGTWPYVSMTPEATRAGLVLLVAYGLLFLVTVQRIRVVEDVERLLRWIAVSAVIMAGFALVQLLTSNGKFFWFYEHPFSKTSDWAKGSFTNRNHFAHFLALGIGPLIWWLQHNRRHGRRRSLREFGPMAEGFQTSVQATGLRFVALGVVLFAALLSLSRGGAVAMLLAAAVCVAVCCRAKTLGTRFVLSLTGVALLIGVLLAVYGYDQVSDRMDDFSSASIDQLDRKGSRRTIWAAVVEAIPDYLLIGSGVGSHREVYQMYLENPPESEFTHAENGPLQVLLETGVVGLALVVTGIGYCVVWSVGGLRKADSRRLLVCAGAAAAGLIASLAHSMVDFVWYVPACTALVAMMAGCACRTYQLAAVSAGKPIRPIAIPRPFGWTIVAVLLLAGVWMVAGRLGPTMAEPHWDRYHIMAQAAETPRETIEEEGEDTSAEDAHGSALEMSARMISELEQVVRYDPKNTRAHLRLAAACLNRFDLTRQTAENPMTLADIRDAAISARERSSDREVDQWLNRALGDRRGLLDLALQHTRQGLELCPLLGEGYLYLAELRFLEGAGSETAQTMFVDQALRVRPYDGAVLFEAGRATIDRARKQQPPDPAALAAAVETATDYWRQSFRSGRTHQERLIRALAGQVPVAYFVGTYQPDLYATRLMHDVYAQLGRPDSAGQLFRFYARMCQAAGGNPGTEEHARAWWQNEMLQLCAHYARAVQDAAEDLPAEKTARAWLEVRRAYKRLGDAEHALACAQNAFQCDANNYDVRYALAGCLIEHRRYAEAEPHLRWCDAQQPGDAKVERLLLESIKKQLDNEDPTLEARESDGLLR
ncbi:MAG TPA: O-antigen ligase family protein [Thermoguttaceae bacterium]|nr:O-antigen ligase family protein [Thermoguttaceae bacterium]